jgi:hypothetical protein
MGTTRNSPRSGGDSLGRLLKGYPDQDRSVGRKTEQAHIHWNPRFIVFHGKRHPSELGEAAISRFLSNLATAGRVSQYTQNQALSALLFLYREVLGRKPRRKGKQGFSRRELNGIARLVTQHADEFLEEWYEFFGR